MLQRTSKPRRHPRGSRTSKMVRSELSDGPSYAGQQTTTLRLEATAQLLATTVTTGVISNSYIVQASQIVSFTARFASTYDEYRILGADFRISPVTASTGVSKMWFDEKSTTIPSSNEAQERTSTPFPNTNANAKSFKTMRWRARDLLDLQYTSTGTTSVQPVTLKTYTDLAIFGAPATVVNLWIVEPILLVEFRGIKST